MLNSGGIPSPKDERDFDLHLVAANTLPPTLSDSSFIDVSRLPVWHQRKIGSCVGHAWGKSQQKCELVETGEVVNLSPRFLYALAKCKDGYSGEGTWPRLVGQILKDYGCATETTIPNDSTLSHEDYVYSRKQENIPQKAFLEAPKYGIAGYAFSTISEQGIKEAIEYARIKNQGVVMLMRVGDTMWTTPSGEITWDKNKILPLRRPSQITSGHEVFPMGYEYINGRLAIHFLNSWSIDWADNGKGWFYWDEWTGLIDEVMTSLDKSDIPSNQFMKDLSFGLKHPDVLKLQKWLNSHGFTIATTGVGSPGKETDFYGSLTVSSVKKMQKFYNIEQTGYFGPKSRQIANTL